MEMKGISSNREIQQSNKRTIKGTSINFSREAQKYTVQQINAKPPTHEISDNSNRKAMNRNWSNQKANPALKTKAGNK